MTLKRMDVAPALKRLAKERAELQNDIQVLSSDTDNYFESELPRTLIEKQENPFPATKAADLVAFQQRVGGGDKSADIERIVQSVPLNIGTRLLKRHPTRIGIICDEFLFHSFAEMADFTRVTPTNWKSLVGSIDILLVCSTWKGQAGEWRGLSYNSKLRQMLIDVMIPSFNDAKCLVAYYSKEDPPNFDKFLPLAKACEVIFTTAEECLERYKSECSNAKAIEVLPFGVNPLFHNPVGSRRYRRSAAVFAGSWHRHKYAGRRNSGEVIFKGIVDEGVELSIFDRNYLSGEWRYAFPQWLMNKVSGPIRHELLLRYQRIVNLNVNLNSVIGSRSMFANRSIELLAMGGSVISNYNAGLNELFPTIHLVEDLQQARDVVAHVFNGTAAYNEQMRGLRSAFADHTSHDRLADLLNTVGLKSRSVSAQIGVVGPEVECAAFIDEQSYKSLTYIGDMSRAASDEDLDFVLEVSPQRAYGREYVQDLVNCFKYTDVEFVVKAVDEADERSHHWITEDGDLAVGMVATDSKAFEEFARVGRLKGRGYLADPFECADRSGASSAAITLKNEAWSEDACAAKPKKQTGCALSVVVPIFNNGKYLINKCFRSLTYSSIFEETEVLLVDDGSTDSETLAILRELSLSYSNVRVMRNEDGGSGSASRPRNQGLQAASAPLIAYLDPDNEALNDAYAELVEHVIKNDVEFAIGNMRRYGERVSTANYNGKLRKVLPRQGEILYTTTSSLSALKFSPMSIQALVANTNWLRGLKIMQPVGAVGQDSFFFQQMLFYAKRIVATPTVVHAYYAALSSSTVNSVSSRFFQKYLPLERERAAWLKKVGLLDEYKNLRFEEFFEGWHLPRLKTLSGAEFESAVEALATINRWYGFSEWKNPETAKLFSTDESHT